jgi:guanylate kinase
MPPSVEALEQRLRGRGTETPANLAMRVEKAAHEMSFSDKFDITIVNATLNQSLPEAENIVRAFLGV